MFKRVIVTTVICCLFLGTTTQATTVTRLTKSGKYVAQCAQTGKSQLSLWGFKGAKKTKAWKLYKKNPLKYYKKYKKRVTGLQYGVVKIKRKKNSYKIWGQVKYKKKIYKTGIYEFKLSKKLTMYSGPKGDRSKLSKQDTKAFLKNPYGMMCTYCVKKGKVYKIYIEK